MHKQRFVQFLIIYLNGSIRYSLFFSLLWSFSFIFSWSVWFFSSVSLIDWTWSYQLCCITYCNTHWIDGKLMISIHLIAALFSIYRLFLFSIWNQKNRERRKNICKQIKWTFSWVHLTGTTKEGEEEEEKNEWNNSRCNCLMLIRKLTIANVPRFYNIGQLHSTLFFFCRKQKFPFNPNYQPKLVKELLKLHNRRIVWKINAANAK